MGERDSVTTLRPGPSIGFFPPLPTTTALPLPSAEGSDERGRPLNKR